MSGGHYDYQQYRITEIIAQVEEDMREIEGGNPHELGQETLNEFRQGLKYLKLAAVYAQRMDWLMSGDDGEESFHDRLEEDLRDLDT